MAVVPSLTAGTQFHIKVSGSYAQLYGVKSCSGSSASKTKVDITSLTDTAKKFLGGQPDVGEFTLEIMYDPSDTTHQALKTAADTPGSATDFKITMADAGAAVVEWSAANSNQGYFDAFGLSFEADTYNKATVKFIPGGVPTITP